MENKSGSSSRRHRNQVWTYLLIAVVLVANGLYGGMRSASAQSTTVRADALVLVNSASSSYADFQHYIKPYLDNFGIPYTALDIATTPVTTTVSNYAVIIVGHRQLDVTGLLDVTEQANLYNAVQGGTGLVNFDNDLTTGGGTPRYQFIQDIFGFGYGAPSTGAGVTFVASGGNPDIRINCWEDTHQNPILPTVTDYHLLNPTDGRWDELLESGTRSFPSVFAAVNESTYGLPTMRFYASGIPDGQYQVIAKLYTQDHARDMRYYYGYTPDNPRAYYVDSIGGTGSSDEHTEYSLGTVTITGGTFNIYVRDAEFTGAGTYPFFGWAWIRLVPTSAPTPVMPYITAYHAASEYIDTHNMRMAGITLPAAVTALATTGNQPFLATTTSGAGRAVQWGSYDWMSYSVKGPMYGLDDLVWRSIVWAARKPFVMQGLPPFVTMRVDDVSGPFAWIHIANEFGFKPWAGLFISDINDAEASDLSALVNAGNATASIHAFNQGQSFYYNQQTGNLSDAQMASNFITGTQWHQAHNIPISKFVLAHFYELGTNSFGGLDNWGVEFIGTQMGPGTVYGSPWIMNGPYRLYESGPSSSHVPMYYADFITVPGHPEFNGHFFNLVTEIRDDAGYEWYPTADVANTVGRGTRQLERALDNMALATLFTHGYFLGDIPPDSLRAILQGITTNIATYQPEYVTMDYAAQYVRAVHMSDITASTYEPSSRQVTTTVGGNTDMPTKFYVFSDDCGWIKETLVDVPTFNGSTQVGYQLPLGPCTLNITTVGNGTVAKDPNLPAYQYGDVVTLTVTPASNWIFGGWSGDLNGAASQQSITMNAHKVVTATFTNNPTSVTLASFNITIAERTAIVQWETADEHDNLGFNLYRAESLLGKQTQLNLTLVPSKAPGGLIGASYEFVDTSTAEGKTYYYWLEFVSVGGSELYGPVTITVASHRYIYLPLIVK